MKPARITCVVGARPNFMKVAPVHAALVQRGATVRLVHTGQHYDGNMSQVFFDDLGMPRPDAFLGVGSAGHAVQTARVMEGFDADCAQWRPDLVIVAGDVNSTLACALVACKRGIAVAHVEAGLRSRDWTMPEEVNRLLTDQCADLLFTPSSDGDANLLAEGVPAWRIHCVGNCMIDSLRTHLPRAQALAMSARFGFQAQGFGLVTLHRPSNVDDPAQLAALLGALGDVAQRLPLLFPVHPRTLQRIGDSGTQVHPALRLCEPLGYLEFLGLQADARLVLTDSGGVQEESTALGVPCLTLRANTERPVTVTEGTNTLIGADAAAIEPAVADILAGRGKAGRVPELWDGCAGERTADVVLAGFRTLAER